MTTTTSATTAADYDALVALGLRTQEDLNAANTAAKNDMGMDTFLELMTTQLQNQDPMKPMENGDFLGQLAQFASVSGLEQLNDSFATLAASMTSSQALQAGGLVGKSVLIQSVYAPYSTEKGLSGELDLESSATDVKVRIYDAAGSLVKTLNLGDQSSGQLAFKWDGSLDAGGYASDGAYKVEADFFDGETRSPLSVLVSADVDSVVVGNSSTGLSLNLTGLGSVSFSDVSRIQ